MTKETNPDAPAGLSDDIAAAWADVLIDLFEMAHQQPELAEADVGQPAAITIAED